jgi:hypothetical protein
MRATDWLIPQAQSMQQNLETQKNKGNQNEGKNCFAFQSWAMRQQQNSTNKPLCHAEEDDYVEDLCFD